MRVREPVVAGRFYPREKDRCSAELARCLSSIPSGKWNIELPLGGMVPHAGWTYSGTVAGTVFAHLARAETPQVVVLFGGVHRNQLQNAALFSDGRWDSPVGSVDVDSRLAERVLNHTSLLQDDPFAHEDEHSLEVQIPFVIQTFPGCPILPIMVPPVSSASEVGEAVGRTLTTYRYRAVVVGTTDLTHYGPGYGFSPKGTGAEGVRWAHAVNDHRFLDFVCELRDEAVVAEAEAHRNACSAGAVAATIAAVKQLGATRGTLVAQADSSETDGANRMSESVVNSVGYGGVVFS